MWQNSWRQQCTGEEEGSAPPGFIQRRLIRVCWRVRKHQLCSTCTFPCVHVDLPRCYMNCVRAGNVRASASRLAKGLRDCSHSFSLVSAAAPSVSGLMAMLKHLTPDGQPSGMSSCISVQERTAHAHVQAMRSYRDTACRCRMQQQLMQGKCASFLCTC